eukprot:7697057-Lingulodinium_polyedra.AAC.1
MGRGDAVHPGGGRRLARLRDRAGRPALRVVGGAPAAGSVPRSDVAGSRPRSPTRRQARRRQLDDGREPGGQ